MLSFCERPAAALFCLVVVFCPAVLQQCVTGGDRFTNSVYVLVFMLLAAWSATRAARWWMQAAALLALGIAFSSRANFVLLFPLWWSYLASNIGWKPASRRAFVVAAVSTGITLPFYLHDPSGFAALYNQFSKVDRFSGVLPYAGWVITAATAALALGLSAQRTSLPAFLRNCAIVQALPVAAGTGLHLIAVRRLDLWYADYGVNFLAFGVISTWLYWQQQSAPEAISARAEAAGAASDGRLAQKHQLL